MEPSERISRSPGSAALVVILICGAMAAAAAAAPAGAASSPPVASSLAETRTPPVSRYRLAGARIRERIKPLREKLFQRAETSFTGFCRDWQEKLRARERNNIAHIAWKPLGDQEAGTYVGYGNVRSCTCKQSSKGIPIGKLSYQEFQYELDGRTPDDAIHAGPKSLSTVNTTEIFRFDDKLGKWVY